MKLRIVFIAIFTLVGTNSCLAWQSGSTISVPSSAPSFNSGSGSTTVIGSEAITTPAFEPDVSGTAANAPSSGRGSIGIPAAALVDPVFQDFDPNSTITVDHSGLDQFLAKYLFTDSGGLNRVKYGQVTPVDRNTLQCYLEYLQGFDVRTINRNEQLAYWFNLYNAQTIALILDHYPLRTVRQIKEKLTDFVGPFDDAGAVTVLGKSLSLNDIESGIVRPIWRDPRIHYAVNCASYGCPNLASTAWTSQAIDGRLNAAAYDYINSDRGVKSGLLGPRLAKIYKWYKDDFGGNDQAVLDHVRQYASPQTYQKLSNHNSIGGYFYDWSLNDGKYSGPRLFESLRR